MVRNGAACSGACFTPCKCPCVAGWIAGLIPNPITEPEMRTPLETNPLNGGVQHLFRFSNGYGASVVRHTFSYTNDNEWELAVLKFTGDKKYKLTYQTPITDDVLGHLSDDDVEKVLQQIEVLPHDQPNP